MKTISSLLWSSKGEGVVDPIIIVMWVEENTPIIALGVLWLKMFIILIPTYIGYLK